MNHQTAKMYEDRWQRWWPWVRRGLLLGTLEGSTLEFRGLHLSRLDTLLAKQISWATIKRLSMDDPRHSVAQFQLLLHSALKLKSYARRRDDRKRTGSQQTTQR